MRDQVKVNLCLKIRMCLECPFYRYNREYDIESCSAGDYLYCATGSSILIRHEDTQYVPDYCPLIYLEKK